jgi:hypothetical protein
MMRSVFILGLLLPLAAQSVPQISSTPLGEFTPQQALALWQRMGAREPFLDSEEAHSEPQSLYRFFDRKDYAKLQGNPVLGYYCPGRFKWTGIRVAWHGISPVTPDAAAVTSKAWDEAFHIIARKRNWVIDPRAPVRVSGACVGAVLEPSSEEPFRGVCIEVRVASPTGNLLYRFSVAKPTIEDAVGAALDWVLCFAATLNQDPTKGPRHGPAQP